MGRCFCCLTLNYEVPKTMAKLTGKTERFFKIPGDEDGAEIKILHLKPGEIQRIEADTSRWVGKSSGEDFSSELEYNPYEQLRRLRLAAVVGWKNFFGLDGEHLDCTPKNKELYLKEDPMLGEKRLSEWIDEFRKELADSLKPQEEESEGN